MKLTNIQIILLGMKILIRTLLNSIIALANVIIFLLFIMLLFGILGTQLYKGLIENRCRLTQEPIDGKWVADKEIHKLCNMNYESSCPEDRYCGNPFDYDIEPNSAEWDIPELNYGFTSFDTILKSTYTIF